MKKLLITIIVLFISSNVYAQKMSSLKYLMGLSQGKYSRIEKSYHKKLGNKQLKQYGYDSFGDKSNSVLSGGAQDDYILGIGDEIKISLVGGKVASYDSKVNKQGHISIEGISPIFVSGLSMKDFEIEIQNYISDLYLDTQAYVSLDKVRSISVTIVGEVKNPGSYNLNSLSRISDLLSLAGGIKKSGSLRTIKLVSSGQSKYIDLYEMFSGSENFEDLLLKQYDRIVILTIGKTISVVGDVENEGIFEILSKDTVLIEKIAGVENSDEIEKVDFSKGSILIISSINETTDVIELIKGDVVDIYSVNNRKYLSEVLLRTDIDYKQDMYPLFGVLERFDVDLLITDQILFNPALVLRKQRDIKLKPSDKITLFSKSDIKEFQDYKGKEDLYISSYIELFKNNSASIYGEVMNEGLYPIIDEVPANDIIGISGGVLPSAITESIEVTKGEGYLEGTNDYNIKDLDTMRIFISSGDSIRIRSKFSLVEDEGVSITGEVKYPGKYTFIRGEKLSSLIKRAGGINEEAYAYGTVYSRESARIKEKQQYKQAARTLEKSLSEYIAKEKEPNSKQIQYSRDLIEDIKKTQPLGRIVVEADPEVLVNNPEDDILLQAGDKIYVPKRSLTVHVMGEVLNPSNLKFKSGKRAGKYIDNAGGYSFYADKSRGFVLLPDGSSKPIKDSSWNFASVSIPEGSTIIVPRDPDPFNFMDTSLLITNVLSNIAITTAAIADIKDD